MFAVLNLAYLLGVLLAVSGLWAVRFELNRRSVAPWPLFLPALVVLLCSLALLAGLSTRGRGIWVIAFVVGVPFGSARAFWLRLRTDYAAKLVRLSPVRDGMVVVAAVVVLAGVDVVMAFRTAGAENKPLFVAAVALGAGYLAGRAVVTRSRARRAVHLDMR